MKINHKKMALKSTWTISELMSMLFEDKEKHKETYSDVLELIRADIRRLYVAPPSENNLALLEDQKKDIETIPILIKAEETKQYLYDKIFDYMMGNNVPPANAIINVVAQIEGIEPEDVLEGFEYEEGKVESYYIKQEKEFKENLLTDEMIEYIASKGVRRKKSWAENCRWKREGGPKYFKFEGSELVYYKLTDIDEWLDQRKK